ncbi:MAG: hypothetical protein Q8R02_10215 [Hyphomonadaceae bacterium]|nr:hypothetical protein [Hyphomonadaceae bacterium]
MNLAILHAVSAFWNTKRLTRKLKSREDVARWRAARLDNFLRNKVPRAQFYAGLGATKLEDLPIVDKATVLANFARMNVAGVTLDEARAALATGEERVRGYIVGQSTGTSGNRGMYIISEVERFKWLGVILAKTLPDFPFTRHKVALTLPRYGQLYNSAAETGRLSLRFFDLALGVDAWREDLVAYAPDTIVAPPKVLRILAETTKLPLVNVFSGAEVLDPLDRQIIEAAFGTKVREIYMATEGLFGVACPHGTLHLAEDAVAFEWEEVLHSDLVTPLVTDFTRSTQIMARYRMNDLLRLSSAPCTCGSPLQAVAAVEGRQDDVFELQGARGPVTITPDVLRNAVVNADHRVQDFRILQTGPRQVELTLADDLPADTAKAARSSLQAALERIGAAGSVVELKSGIEASLDRKLRRVRREWRG